MSQDFKHAILLASEIFSYFWKVPSYCRTVNVQYVTFNKLR